MPRVGELVFPKGEYTSWLSNAKWMHLSKVALTEQVVCLYVGIHTHAGMTTQTTDSEECVQGRVRSGGKGRDVECNHDFKTQKYHEKTLNICWMPLFNKR